ncbi:MAG: nickel/cobalt transporter [Chloroflexi bacterium]|nr:nickel/cobalt transporter [Chloroflexota bacterium]
MFDPTYLGVIAIGLLHGIEPGHGWPVAVLYSMRKKNAIASATLSSSIIGIGHLASSIAVVVAYVLLQRWLNFEAPWIKYAAAALLLLLAFKLFREKVDDLERQHGHNHPDNPEIKHEHEHEHPGQGPHMHRHKHQAAVALSLLGLASFAFILGFAHEEEIALLALVAGGLNAWILMVAYGVSVLLGLIVATIVGVKVYKQFKPRLARYEKYIPKIGAGLLVAMALLIILR